MESHGRLAVSPLPALRSVTQAWEKKEGASRDPLGWGWGHPAGKGRWKSELSRSWHLQSQNSEALAPSSWALRQGQSSLLFLPSGYMRTGD